jgi:hypothetical protein
MALNASHTRSIQHPSAINCGNLIKTLHFDLMPGDQLRTRVDLYEYIHTLLRHARNVEDIWLSDQYSPTTLSLLSILVVRTLNKLEVSLSDISMEGLVYINEFKNLTELGIESPHSKFSASSDISPWALPALRNLSWMTQQDEELDYMAFLARSSLPALKTLSIFT